MNTKAKSTKVDPVLEVVKAHFEEGTSKDQVLESLFKVGVKFQDLESTLDQVAKANGFILSPEEIQEKVQAGLKDQEKPIDFSEVVALAGQLNIPQVSNDDLLDEVQKHFGTNLKEHKKFKMLRKATTKHGAVATWIKAHPSFTAKELIESGVVDGPQAMDYYQEFLAYQAFFKELG